MANGNNQPDKSGRREIHKAIIGAVGAVLGAVLAAVITVLLTDGGKTNPPPSSPPATNPSSTPPIIQTPPSTSLSPVPSPSPPAPGPQSLRVSKGMVQPGETVVISGRGYPANIQLEFTWNVHVPEEAFGVGKRSLGTGDVGERGTFAVAVTLPADVCNGTGTIDAFTPSTPIPQLQTNLYVQGANC